jgi:hypothetical protein
MVSQKLTKEEIQAAVKEIDRLSCMEYGRGLLDLLANPQGFEQLERLTGVLLKRNFATSIDLEGRTGNAGARRAWKWQTDRFSDSKVQQTREFEILETLQEYHGYQSLNELADDADHERGLFKILALWVSDKLKGEKGKSFREYFEAEETPNFEALLDVSTLTFQMAAGAALAAVVPVPAIAVSLGLIATQYGYRRITQAQERPDEE